jgi:hypothetical protein
MALAEDLEWSIEGFRKAFQEISIAGLAQADWKARVVWIRNAIKYNKPENPNVVKGWRAAWDEVPECPLKCEANERLQAFTDTLGESFGQAFREACGSPFANQKQEQEQPQEQEQEQKQKHSGTAPPAIESELLAANKGSFRRAMPHAATDERFRLFVEALDSYWKFKNPGIPLTFGKAEGAQLNRLLADNPQLAVEVFQDCLQHRAHSEVVHSEPPRKWLASALQYANGPLDRYGKPMREGHERRAQSAADERLSRILTKTAAASGRTGRAISTAAIGMQGAEHGEHHALEGDVVPVPNCRGEAGRR